MPLALANNHLAVNLHRLLAAEKGNVFFSPFSISSAMAMLLCAAAGETESEMRTVLGYDQAGMKRDEIAPVFGLQMWLLMNPNSYTLYSANSMLSQKDFEVKDEYKQILAERFEALMLEVDFLLENQKAVNQINDWVKEKTNGMITELVQSLDPATVIVLLNAVYFKGTWLRQFQKSATFPQEFYSKGMDDNVKKVDMMHLTDKFYLYEDNSMQALKLPYLYEDNSMQALELPYIEDEVAMIVLLPRKKNGLQKIEDSFTPSFFGDLKGKLSRTEVNVSLPKFRLEYTKSLIPCFQRLGISRVFRRGAELGVASDSPDLAVSGILHKAVLEVNEEGSEAAAVTEITNMPASSILKSKFVADHPFAFVIVDTRSGLILFMGRVDEL